MLFRSVFFKNHEDFFQTARPISSPCFAQAIKFRPRLWQTEHKSTRDLILNLHAGFDAAELFRLLRPNGMLITEQAGGNNDRELLLPGAPLRGHFAGCFKRIPSKA